MTHEEMLEIQRSETKDPSAKMVRLVTGARRMLTDTASVLKHAGIVQDHLAGEPCDDENCPLCQITHVTVLLDNALRAMASAKMVLQHDLKQASEDAISLGSVTALEFSVLAQALESCKASLLSDAGAFAQRGKKISYKPAALAEINRVGYEALQRVKILNALEERWRRK